MGAGSEITKINAKPWTDALKNLVGGPPLHCYTFLLTNPGVQTSATHSAAEGQKALVPVPHAPCEICLARRSGGSRIGASLRNPDSHWRDLPTFTFWCFVNS
jgi:hypothetical protein